MQNLATGALKEYHWDELSVAVGFKIEADDELTLEYLLENGILDQMDEVENVATVAAKEHNLDLALDAMMTEWGALQFELKEHKTSFVLRGVDEIQALLDDHLVKTQSMMGSPYIANIKGKAKGWEQRLVTLQNLLDEWLRVQRTWMYLQPIFSSDDIMRQMPTEGRKFATIDAMFIKAMDEVQANPSVLAAAARDGMLSNFRSANKNLDVIQKNLADYLEVKRLHFPRFYFLANDGLLEILSQTKDVRKVQKHLDKCFEGLNRIAFRGDREGNPDDLVIVEIGSADGEKVDLVEFVDPNKGDNKGNVEKWLNQLLGAMRVSVKEFVKKSIEDYPAKKRIEWILAHPAQAVLNISQLFWTREAEDAMRTGGNAGLATYKEQLDG